MLPTRLRNCVSLSGYSHVRFWPIADMTVCAAHVRFQGKADMTVWARLLLRLLSGVKRTCVAAPHDPLLTQSGHLT